MISSVVRSPPRSNTTSPLPAVISVVAARDSRDVVSNKGFTTSPARLNVGMRLGWKVSGVALAPELRVARDPITEKPFRAVGVRGAAHFHSNTPVLTVDVMKTA